MFSRGGSAPRRGHAGSGAPLSSRGSKDDTYDTPLDELISCLDRMEVLVEKARTDWEEQTRKPPPQSKEKPKARAGWRRASSDSKLKATGPAKTAAPMSSPTSFFYKEQNVKFLQFEGADEAELVELLRRTAELVVRGEKGAAAAQSKRDKQSRQTESEAENGEGGVSKEEDSNETDFESHIALFEHFFERNALALIVNIVTGEAFTAPSTSPQDPGSPKEEEPKATGESSDDTCTMLPPLPIATQAVQSVSILIQNVSRATSLYFLLSNNHINELNNLPLELYTIAEQNKRGDNTNGFSTKKYSSPELAELNTHFVTFLKSLALRMNTETLQFYLTYPTEHYGDESDSGTDSRPASSAYFCEDASGPDDESPLDETETNRTQGNLTSGLPVVVPMVEVEFPLYARALEFCSPHQDSFVRVTAMNICLNTLRLSTVSSTATETAKPDDECETDALAGPATPQLALSSSPNAVLHNAEPLPLRERLAIAQHVCAPSRVEGLVSPIFTKLAQLWGMLEELIRELESVGAGRVGDAFKGQRTKAEKAKEEVRRTRLTDSFNDTVANLQDELLLLEDVFKVGLTSLNEQIIEMMLATFVYPLLLQPLLSYMQHFPSDSLSSSRERNSGLLGEGPDSDFLERSGPDFGGDRVHHDTAPAKTAFFALAAVFHLLTNQPLLRLLLTALFHPLAPEASGEIMIRAKPDVACSGPDDEVDVRVDEPVSSVSRTIPYSRTTYLFGKLTGARGSSVNNLGGSPSYRNKKDESCVFVLSPALADVLESLGDGVALIARTRPNPYRRAILSCLADTGAMSHLRSLSVLSVDAAISKFDGKFVSDILFGMGVKTVGNEIPIDERRMDTRRAHDKDDRGMGGAAVLQSRRSLPSAPSRFQNAIGVSNYMVEVIASLCVSVMDASAQCNGISTLGFDRIAAHALLCATRENPKAMQTASKMITRRQRQIASFLVQLPSRIANEPDTSLTGEFKGGIGPTSVTEDDEQHLGRIMERIFYERILSDGNSVVEELLRLDDNSGTQLDEDNCFVTITRESSFDDLSDKLCDFEDIPDPASADSNDLASLRIAARCAYSYLQLGAFSELMQELAATNGSILRERTMAGFAISRNGSIKSTTGFYDKDLERSLFAPVSHNVSTALFAEQEDEVHPHGKGSPKTGSVVGLVGRTAFPCVCEVPSVNASLFTGDTACVVAEGVKWQSLYLVFIGRYMILAEPEKGGSGGNGRIVTSCNLARLKVEKDEALEGSASPARRLLLSHDSFEENPPSLFLLEEESTKKTLGPFVRLQRTHSCMDLWFEDETAADRAFKVIDVKVARAKSRRGNSIREKLVGG